MDELEATSEGSARYRPIAELGHGGMAQVYLALSQGPAGFHKLVVIKQIRAELAEDPEFLAMFLDEARLAARLNHPNVVQTNEVGFDGERYFICMEFLEGQPLNRIINRVGRAKGFTLGMHLRVLVDALAGLQHAHELKDYDGTPMHVVHRDATPHNIFLTYAGQVKVVDFGIAKAANSSSETRAGVLKGKVAYMAPEQARGEPLDQRADIFSVGMMMWEALAGTRLFKGMPDVAILRELESGPLPRPSSIDPSIAPLLDDICIKALAYRREDRFETAADMATAIEEALEVLGEKGTVRDAGRLLDSVFASERSTIQKLVEAQAAEVAGPARLAKLSPFGGRDGTASRALAAKVDDGPTRDESAPGRLDAPTSATKTRASPASQSADAGVAPLALAGRAEDSVPSTLAATSPHTTPPPAANEAQRPKWPLFAGLAAALAIVIAVVATRGGGGPGPAALSSAASASAHVILIDSTPQGASVRDGDTVLGTTPMSYTLEAPSAGAAPKKLVIALAGYRPHTFLPSRDDTRVMVPLAVENVVTATPATAATSAAPATPNTTPRPAGPAGPKPTSAPKPPPASDINMAR